MNYSSHVYTVSSGMNSNLLCGFSFCSDTKLCNYQRSGSEFHIKPNSPSALSVFEHIICDNGRTGSEN